MRRRHEISARTKGAILAAARRLFAEQGYAETAMREIAGAAKVSKAAIYHYFRDKHGLYELLIGEGVRTLTREVRRVITDDPAPVVLGRILLLHLRFAEEHPELSRLLMQEELRGSGRNGRLLKLVGRHRQEEQAVFEAVLARGIERGEFKAVHPTVSAEALAAVVHILSAGFLRTEPRLPPREVAENAMDVLLNGLGAVALPADEIRRLMDTLEAGGAQAEGMGPGVGGMETGIGRIT